MKLRDIDESLRLLGKVDMQLGLVRNGVSFLANHAFSAPRSRRWKELCQLKQKKFVMEQKLHIHSLILTSIYIASPLKLGCERGITYYKGVLAALIFVFICNFYKPSTEKWIRICSWLCEEEKNVLTMNFLTIFN